MMKANTKTSTTISTTASTTANITAHGTAHSTAKALTKFQLLVRTSEKPATNPNPPHLQFNQHSPRHVYKKMADWMFNSFEKSREHETLISVPSSRAMWLDENIKNTPSNGFMPPPPHSREFAHLHKDGSIHVCLPEAVIRQVLNAKWGEPHPYKHLGVNEILVYAPQDEDEMAVLKQVIIASYEYVTGEVYQA